MKHEQELYAKGAICRPVGVHRAPIGALCEGSSMWTCGGLLEGSSMWLYSACLFWNKQATHILKTIKILLLMVQFHNGTLKSCELGLGGDRHWLSEPTTCFRIIGKELCFHKTGPIMMPKRIGCKISTIFICTYRRQDDQNCHSWSHENFIYALKKKNIYIYICLELVSIYVMQSSIALVPKCRRWGNLSNNVHFLDKCPFVYIRGWNDELFLPKLVWY